MTKTFSRKLKVLAAFAILLLFFISLEKVASNGKNGKDMESAESTPDPPNEFLTISGIGPFSNLLILNQFRKK